jgi:Glycogen debranching enzyme
MLQARKGNPDFLSNHGCCASPYGYVIGRQDGRFPSFGGHVEGEMGGVWIHPVKLLDGFWLSINGEALTFTQYEILPYGQRFSCAVNGLEIERLDWMPKTHKGAVIVYSLHNTTDSPIQTEVDFLVRFHLLPVWFSERKGYGDAPDEAAVLPNQTLVAWDGAHPWAAAVCAEQPAQGTILYGQASPDKNPGTGKTARLSSALSIAPGETAILRYIVAGSHHSKEEALGELTLIKRNHSRLLAQKQAHCETVEKTAKITTDCQELNTVLSWVKQNTDWLVQTVDEYGTGLAAGIPEYVWWFGCDNSYALQGCLAAGMTELCKETIRLLKRFSHQTNGNGRIVHEINTYGVVSNPGNTQETAHYITMVRKIWDWTGDVKFLEDVYDECKLSIEWLMAQAEDGNPMPRGYGIMEIEGLNIKMIDVAVYTCQALLDMYALSIAAGEENLEYLKKGEALWQYIDTHCWIEEQGQFCDGIATPEQLLSRMDKLYQRAEEHSKCKEAYRVFLKEQERLLHDLPKEKEIPFLLAKNWVVLTPMESGLAKEEKALRALGESFNEDYIGTYGVYLSSLMKDHIMTISTGVRAVAEMRYGRMDESYSLLECLMRTFEKYMPGTLSEMSPDYGCFAQAWTIYGALVPVVNGFAGIHADAASKTVTIAPKLPKQLNHLRIEALPVGDGEITVDITRLEKGLQTQVHSTLTDWKHEVV